jgi:hypothetical protein
MFKIENYKPMSKNSLRGLFDVNLGGRFLVKGWTHHEKNGKEWVGPPAKPCADKDGKQQWSPIIEFLSSDARDNFRKWAIGEIEKLRPSRTAASRPRAPHVPKDQIAGGCTLSPQSDKIAWGRHA